MNGNISELFLDSYISRTNCPTETFLQLQDWMNRGFNLQYCLSKSADSFSLGETMSELHVRIILWIEAGDKPEKVANRFQVALSTVYNVKKLFKETGGFDKHAKGGRPRTA